jgi:hypothetical protein
MKRYIADIKMRDDGEKVDYWFCSSQKEAMSWGIRELADAELWQFNRGITINEDIGRAYVLRNFEVEERAPGEFVVFADGPFVVRTRGEGEAKSKAV